MAAISAHDDTFSDLTIKFEGQTRKVHKFILYQTSGWFAKALTSGFKEATDGTISLFDDGDAKIIHAMIDHCYGVSYKTIKGAYGESHYLFEALLYVVADKYDVPTLKTTIESTIFEGWFYPEGAEGAEALDGGTTGYRFYEALDCIYGMLPSTNLAIRQAFLARCSAYTPEMLKEKKFQALLLKYAQLGADMLSLLTTDDGGIQADSMVCSTCEAQYTCFKQSLCWPSLFCVNCKDENYSEVDGRVIGFKTHKKRDWSEQNEDLESLVIGLFTP